MSTILDRLVEDQDFYVRVQKTKLLIGLLGILFAILRWKAWL